MKEKEQLGEKPLYGIWGLSFNKLNITGVFYLNESQTTAFVDFYGDAKIIEDLSNYDKMQPLFGSIDGKFILLNRWYLSRTSSKQGIIATLNTRTIQFEYYFWSYDSFKISVLTNRVYYTHSNLKFWLPAIDELKKQYLDTSDKVSINLTSKKEVSLDCKNQRFVKIGIGWSRSLKNIEIFHAGFYFDKIRRKFEPHDFVNSGIISEVVFSLLTQKPFPIQTLTISRKSGEEIYLEYLSNKKYNQINSAIYDYGFKFQDLEHFLISTPNLITNLFSFFENECPDLTRPYWFTLLRSNGKIEDLFVFYYSWIERLIKDFFKDKENATPEEKLSKKKLIFSKLDNEDIKWLNDHFKIDLKEPIVFLKRKLDTELGFEFISKEDIKVFKRMKEIRDNFVHKDRKKGLRGNDFVNFNPLLRIYLNSLILKKCGLPKESVIYYAKQSLKDIPASHLFSISELPDN
ncbi:MAG: hypothetical protein LCH54_17040 [Bacteroidetes bacterium]|nr:hypothetical protein [Bacteroidota bacterium]